MKKINLQFIAIMVSIIGSLVYGSMRFAALEQRVTSEREFQCDTNKRFVETVSCLTVELRLLRTEIRNTRHEIELNRLRSE